MSHSMIFMRYDNGFTAISCDPLLRVLRRHGFLPWSLVGTGVSAATASWTPVGTDNAVDLVSPGNARIGDVSIHVKAGAIAELAVDRPCYCDRFRAFAFDLISEVGLVMFPSFGGELYASAAAGAALPEWLTSQFEHLNLDVRSADEL
jgi:hypothetical protein